ncbi:hypothetical protein LEQ41_04055 [Streptococcus agalactiae]|nr:hypothetical protein [Streptococcus agalactiae]
MVNFRSKIRLRYQKSLDYTYQTNILFIKMNQSFVTTNCLRLLKKIL